MYFALTTITTIGLGDYYPKTNTERVICAFVLLLGSMTTNYIMAELMFMITKVQLMSYDFVEEEK